MGTRRATALIVASLIAMAGWTSLGAGRAQACSCGPIDPLALVDQSEIVFTGTAAEQRDPETFFATLTFSVDRVIKGEVPPTFEIAAGLTDACGPNYAFEGVRHVVYLSRERGELGLMGCAPLVTAADFERRLLEPDPALSDDPIEIVSSGPVGLNDLLFLDSMGRPVGEGSIGAIGQLAHCTGTDMAAMAEVEMSRRVHLVDLNQIAIEQTWDLGEVPVWPIELSCLDAASRVVVAQGDAHEPGPASITLIDVDGGSTTDIEREGVAQVVVHPAGTVMLLPLAPGEPVEVLGGSDLTMLAEVELPASVSVVDAAVSPDGAQLAVLATTDGSIAEYDTGGTDVLLLRVVDGVPSGRPLEIIHVSDSTGTPWPDPDGPPSSEPDPDAPGAFRRVEWLHDGRLRLEEFAVPDVKVHVVEDGVVRREPAREVCGEEDRVATSTGEVCLIDGAAVHVDRDGAVTRHELTGIHLGGAPSLMSVTDGPLVNPRFPPPRAPELTPIGEVDYDVEQAAVAMAELLERDRDAFESRSGFDDDRWRNRAMLVLVVVGLLGAVGGIVWVSRPNRR